MQFNHRNNDLQIYYDRSAHQITPTRKRSPTPIRIGSVRLLPSKQNIPKSNSSRNIHDYSNNGNVKLQFPSKKIKPMISPSRHPFPEMKFNFAQERVNQRHCESNSMLESEKNQKYCPNHPNKVAQFLYQLQDDQMLYCEKCAAQLASQGFEITRLENPTVKKRQYPKKTVRKVQQQLPKHPEYQGSKMYKQIILFLKELNSIQQEHHENMDRFEEIDNHYNKQIKITENFYDELLKTIEIMKQDHLSDLIQESRRHSQIADIEHDYLRENVDEMDIIRKDIVNNLQVIMQKLEEDELYENLNEYRQKIQVFRHKVEEQTDIFQEVISYTEDDLSKKQVLIQDYLLDVWAEKEKQNKNKNAVNKNAYEVPKPKQNYSNPHQNGNGSQRSTKPIMQGNQQIQKKVQNVNNPPAFRKLFDDEDNGLVSETSPQFKKI